jgi:hypothetical protein
MRAMLIGPERAARREPRAWRLLLLAVVLVLVIAVAPGCGETEERFVGTWVNEERNIELEIATTDSGWVVYPMKGASEGSPAKEEDGKLVWGYGDSQVFEVSDDLLKWTLKEPVGEIVYLERRSQ